MDGARIDKIAEAVINQRIHKAVHNRVVVYGGGTEADKKKVLKAIGQKLS